MAKKQTVSSAESKLAATANRKPPVAPASKAEPGRKQTIAKGSGRTTRVLAQEEIGSVAGEVWHALSQGGESLPTLKKKIDVPGDLVLAAVGWLAREGKLDFDNSGRTLRISLR